MMTMLVVLVDGVYNFVKKNVHKHCCFLPYKCDCQNFQFITLMRFNWTHDNFVNYKLNNKTTFYKLEILDWLILNSVHMIPLHHFLYLFDMHITFKIYMSTFINFHWAKILNVHVLLVTYCSHQFPHHVGN
jgi:hypothetical protein